MALAQACVPVRIHEVALRDKPAELLAASPKATVPVLVTARGDVIEESLDVMRWALAQNDPDGWLDCDAEATRHWTTLNDITFKPLLDRYKYSGRHPEQTPEAHRRAAMVAFVQPLNNQLQQSTWLVGDRVSMADVALFPFVRQFAGVDKTWFDAQAIGAVQGWLQHWLDSSLFHAVMEKTVTQKTDAQSV